MKLKEGVFEVTAFAPASVANVAVGFDLLGFSFESVGDEVLLRKVKQPIQEQLQIKSISGIQKKIPLEIKKNVATVALKKMLSELKITESFEVEIKKGIPLSSGMGGSAASAVASVMALNSFLEKTLSKEELFEFALEGEHEASRSYHADNVGPSLFGGLQVMQSFSPLERVSIPLPKDIFCALIHPSIEIETKVARSILKPTVLLTEHVRQASFIFGFTLGCVTGNLDLIRKSMCDVLIEPQRAHLIPGFDELKQEAISLKALGFSISGSGPSVFAWSESRKTSELLKEKLISIFQKKGVQAQGWVEMISSSDSKGARILAVH